MRAHVIAAAVSAALALAACAPQVVRPATSLTPTAALPPSPTPACALTLYGQTYPLNCGAIRACTDPAKPETCQPLPERPVLSPDPPSPRRGDPGGSPRRRRGDEGSP